MFTLTAMLCGSSPDKIKPPIELIISFQLTSKLWWLKLTMFKKILAVITLDLFSEIPTKMEFSVLKSTL